MNAHSVAKLSLVQDEPETDQQITVAVNDADDGLAIAISPRVLRLGPGSYTVTWVLAQNVGTTGWSIDSIAGMPAVLDGKGVWTIEWKNGLTSPDEPAQDFPYTINLTKTFDKPPVTANVSIDPVIENDPPPHEGPDDDRRR